jgi:protein SCO1
MKRVLREKALWASLLCSLPLCVAVTGCRHSTEVMSNNTQIYSVKGTILAVDPAAHEITLQHDAIPGFMEAMTMPYKLSHPEIIGELHPGDVIRARLLVEKDSDGVYHGARLDEFAVLAQARPSFKPQSDYHVPAPGDPVPDFHLIDQDGKSIHLGQYHGKALLITFIYTRCPMDDFCPKMSRNFAAIEKSLSSDKGLLDRSNLLSISFDPAFDTPAVLRAYGNNYTAGQGFAHWQFATPGKDADSLAKMEKFFNVGVTPPDSKDTLTHSLSTVLVGPEGKIAAWYPGSEWTPQEVVQKVRSLAKA